MRFASAVAIRVITLTVIVWGLLAAHGAYAAQCYCEFSGGPCNGQPFDQGAVNGADVATLCKNACGVLTPHVVPNWGDLCPMNVVGTECKPKVPDTPSCKTMPKNNCFCQYIGGPCDGKSYNKGELPAGVDLLFKCIKSCGHDKAKVAAYNDVCGYTQACEVADPKVTACGVAAPTGTVGQIGAISGGKSINLTNPLGTTSIPQLIGQIINAVLGFVGSIALLMFIYGGFTWLTSRGSADSIKRGTGIMVWSIAGLVLIFSSYALVKLILGALK